MAFVNPEQIKALTGAGQALGNMEKAAASLETDSGDWLAKTERILGGINTLMENVAKMRGMPQSQAAGPSSRTLDESHETRRISAPDATRSAGPTAPIADERKSNDMVNKLAKPVIGKLAEYLDTCIAENPNMSIGEAIQKAPLNVTQVRGILEIISKLI